NHQFLMLGLEGAGKTTLLYKLRIEGWKSHEIILAMKNLKKSHEGGEPKDPAYHYEEFQSTTLGSYGIWDIPGDEVMRRLWPMFYRYLHIGAVLFVVDAFSPDTFSLNEANLQRLRDAKAAIHYLLNEDELRTAAFVVILNMDTHTQAVQSKGASAVNLEEQKEMEGAILEMLGVPEIMQQNAHKDRFQTAVLNCSETSRKDPKWEQILKDVYRIQLAVKG
ncbi:unnamed protein product, partial [Polarella glacialis]